MQYEGSQTTAIIYMEISFMAAFVIYQKAKIFNLSVRHLRFAKLEFIRFLSRFSSLINMVWLDESYF